MTTVADRLFAFLTQWRKIYPNSRDSIQAANGKHLSVRDLEALLRERAEYRRVLERAHQWMTETIEACEADHSVTLLPRGYHDVPEDVRITLNTASSPDAQGGQGQERLWTWFGLSRASWLTIPRVLLHAMPDDWQDQMATLLAEYEDQFPNQPELRTEVSTKDVSGRYVETPDWLLNYRHPDQAAIEECKS